MMSDADSDDIHSRYSVQTFVVILLTLNPSLSLDALRQQLHSLGLEPSTISLASMRNRFDRHFEVLDAAGLIDHGNQITRRRGLTPKGLTRRKHKADHGTTRSRVYELLRKGVRKSRIADQLCVSRARVTQIANRWTGESS